MVVNLGSDRGFGPFGMLGGKSNDELKEFL